MGYGYPTRGRHLILSKIYCIISWIDATTTMMLEIEEEAVEDPHRRDPTRQEQEDTEERGEK